MTEGRRLFKNSALNLSTGVVILGLNLLFVPLTLHAFGTELYGILSVTWMVLANLAWLDMGFSRATARFVAQDLSVGKHDKAAVWAWTAVTTQTLLGLAGGVILSCLAPFIVDNVHVQPENRELVILSLRLFAFAIPVQFATRSMIGVLQAGERFDWINALAILSSLSTFVVYGCGILLAHNFLVVIYGLFLLRVLDLAASFWAASRVLPLLKSFANLGVLSKAYYRHAVTMVQYGFWIAAASAFGPLLLYFDQLLISAVMGIALLPFYTIPFNLLGKLGLFPSAISSTLFPAFSAMQARADWGGINEYFVRANRYLLTMLMPILFVLYVWAPTIFTLWIGMEFAAQATLPFRILILGYGFALLAPLSGVLLEAVGRPDTVTKLFVIEAPFNIAIVWILTKSFGLEGAALSYTVRAIVETILIWFVVARVTPISISRLLQAGLLRPFVTVVLLVVGALFISGERTDSLRDIACTLATLSVYAAIVLLFVLDRKDKDILLSSYKNRRRPIPALPS
jgi:O-antigen/teichoic acid export membrane protein